MEGVITYVYINQEGGNCCKALKAYLINFSLYYSMTNTVVSIRTIIVLL